MKITLSGMEGLLKALSGAEVKGKVSKVVQKHGAAMHKAALRNVPVDTGHLKRSITLEVSSMTAKVQEHTEYGKWVETGTRKMAAQPYMKPALNSVEGQFVADLRKAVK